MSATLYHTQGEQVKQIGMGGIFPSADLQHRYERIIRYLAEDPRQYFESAEPPVLTPVLSLRRPVSELVKCRAESPEGTVGIYIKFFLPRRPTLAAKARAIEKMHQEVEITRELYTRLGTDSVYAVPRILAFFPEEKAVVMEESIGRRLLDVLQQKGRGSLARSALDELAQSCRAVGGWLKHFQHLTQMATGQKVDRVEYLDYVAQRLKKLRASQNLLQEVAVERILRSLEQLLQQLPDNVENICGVHGDLSLSNILVTSNKVTVLDFSMYQIGSSCHDLSYFCSRIESFYNFSVKNPMVSHLQKSFMDGYGDCGEINRDLLKMYYIRHKINRILSLSYVDNLNICRKIYQKYQFYKCWKDLNKYI
jgi:tRNA A-37 threonylcarbamoyl transferase component Bud32